MSKVSRSDLRLLAVAAHCLSVQVNKYRKHLELGAGSGLSRMALAQSLVRPLADVEEELIRLDVSPSDPLPLWTKLHHPNAPDIVHAVSILVRAVCEMRGGVKHFGKGAANRSFLPKRCIDQAANLATAADLLAENVTTDGEGQPAVENNRLRFDRQTLTVYLDDRRYFLPDPKVFGLYQLIAECATTITRRQIREDRSQFRGDKAVPHLLDKLPPLLRRTIKSNNKGYWFQLPVLKTNPCTTRK